MIQHEIESKFPKKNTIIGILSTQQNPFKNTLQNTALRNSTFRFDILDVFYSIRLHTWKDRRKIHKN